MMNESKNKKQYKQWLSLIIIALVGLWIINNVTTVGNIFNNIINIVFPFILGAGIAFILNIPMTFFEKKLCKSKKDNKRKETKNSKGKRFLAIIFAILVIVLILTLVIRLIVPELINIGKLLIDNIPYYTEQLNNLMVNMGYDISDINNIIQDLNIDFENIKNGMLDTIPKILTSSVSFIGSIVGGIADFLIAIVFAIYILMDKEKLIRQAKKIVFAYANKKRAYSLVYTGKVINNTFKSFFTVQCLEAFILGTLCTIGMLILRIPYAMPIGVLIGVTALIPIVGAFIGAIIGSILILSVEPIKVLVFIIFILVLQQVEGNLIYPRVVGGSLGVPSMWVLVAVTIGGSLGGILGMLIGVPTVSVIYALVERNVNKRIERNNKLKKGE